MPTNEYSPSSTPSFIPFILHTSPTPATLLPPHPPATESASLGPFSVGSPGVLLRHFVKEEKAAKPPLPPGNGGKCQCQPSRPASILSPLNTQHSGCYKDEGAHSLAQGPLHINTPNDKAPWPSLRGPFTSHFVLNSHLRILQISHSRNFQKLQNIISAFSVLPLILRQSTSRQPPTREWRRQEAEGCQWRLGGTTPRRIPLSSLYL